MNYLSHRFSYDGYCVCGHHIDATSHLVPCPYYAPALVADTNILERRFHRVGVRREYMERYGYNVEIVNQRELVDEETSRPGLGRTWYSSVVYRYSQEYQDVTIWPVHGDFCTISWTEYPYSAQHATGIYLTPHETEPGFSRDGLRVVHNILVHRDDLVRHGCPLRELDGITPIVEFER